MSRPPSVPLGSLADFVNGDRGKKYPSGDAFVAEGIPFISAADIADGRVQKSEAKKISREVFDRLGSGKTRDGDVLFCLRGSLGKTARFEGLSEAAIASSLVIIRAKKHVDTRFLYYLLSSPVVQGLTEALDNGSVQPNLSVREIKKILVPDFGHEAQGAIAHILGTLDDKIELNRRMSETLESIARALFQSWFVDFDPVRAKSEWRDPNLPGPVADLFPGCFEDSELGEIPRGWSVGDIYTLADVIYGAPFKSSLFNEDRVGKPLIRIRDLATHDPSVFTSEKHPRGYLVQPGDLIVGMDGEFRAHLWRGPEAWLNQRLCCFSPKEGIPRGFVHYSIESLLDFFERSKTGTTVIHLGKSDIDTFRVLVPPVPILRAFARAVEPIDARIVTAAKEARTLVAQRDALLPKLFSGDVRVQVFERIPSAAK